MDKKELDEKPVRASFPTDNSWIYCWFINREYVFLPEGFTLAV